MQIKIWLHIFKFTGVKQTLATLIEALKVTFWNDQLALCTLNVFFCQNVIVYLGAFAYTQTHIPTNSPALPLQPALSPHLEGLTCNYSKLSSQNPLWLVRKLYKTVLLFLMESLSTKGHTLCSLSHLPSTFTILFTELLYGKKKRKKRKTVLKSFLKEKKMYKCFNLSNILVPLLKSLAKTSCSGYVWLCL